MPRNTTVRTSSNPVNDPEQTVITSAPAVHPLPPEITNHPAWRETWRWLFERIASSRRDDEAA